MIFFLLLYVGLCYYSGEENNSPFQYSCLENPMDRGACRLWSMGLQELDMTYQLKREVNMHTHIYIFFLQLSFSLLSWGADYFFFFWEGREIIIVEFKGSENSLDIYDSYPFKNSFYSCLGWFNPHHIRFSW